MSMTRILLLSANHFQLLDGKSTEVLDRQNVGCFADRQNVCADWRLRTTGLLMCLWAMEIAGAKITLYHH